MSKLTLHLQYCPSWVPEFVQRSGVEWLKWVDPPQEQPAWAAGVKVIGRTFEEDSISNARIWQGAAGARSWFDKWLPIYRARPWVHCWEGPNEPQPMADPAFRFQLNAFTVELARLMHAEGLRLVGMNWSVGNSPDTDEAARQLGPGVQACDYLGLHEYSAPTMQDTVTWHCLRYRRTVALLEAVGYTVPPIIVGECGIDGGVEPVYQPGKAWRTFCEEDFSRYLPQLAWYSNELDKDDVACATIFTVCDWDWFDFAITETEAMPLADWIAQDAPPVPVERARGIDVSQWQGVIDWQQVAQSVDFVFIRATVGLAVDPRFVENWEGAGAVGLLRGVYHYLHQNEDGQAAHFIRTVGDRIPELGYYGDLEQDTLTAEKCQRFLEATDRNIEEIGQGYPPCHVYTRASLFDRFGNPSWAKGRLLWVADYRDLPEPILPMAWNEWEFWQYTSDGAVPGIVGRVDLDVYAGTPEQLHSEYGNGEEPEGGDDMWDSVGFEDVALEGVSRADFGAFWGVNMKRFAPTDLPAGAVYYKLVKLTWREGWCGLNLKVVDADGNPLAGEQVFQGWVDGADLPADVAPLGGQPGAYPNKGGGGFTNSDGIHDWGWGPGEWFDPVVVEGPHWYWRGGENGAYSDVVCGFGWWDEHEVLEPTFMRVIVEDGEEPEEPEEPEEGTDLTAVVEELRGIREVLESELSGIRQALEAMQPVSYSATIVPSANVTWTGS